MRISHLPLVAVLGVLAVGTTPMATIAQWIPNGFPLCGNRCYGYAQAVMPDGVGGMFVAWTEQRDYATTDYDVYAQRVARSGTLPPGWSVSGLGVSVLGGIQAYPSIGSDGNAGLLMAWLDGRIPGFASIYAQRVASNGTTLWPANGAPVVTGRTDPSYNPYICSDGNGGAFVVWSLFVQLPREHADVYAQHLLADGSRDPQWPVDGLPLCTEPGEQLCSGIVSDGAGGFVTIWTDTRRGSVWDTYGQHILADGSVALGWVAGGNLLLPGRSRCVIALDPAGGFYVAAGEFDWEASYRDFYLKRYQFSGVQAAGWPSDGFIVCNAPDVRNNLTMVPDGLGGVLIAWFDYRTPSIEIFAQRVRPDATLPPGWTPNGVMVSDPTSDGVETMVDIAPDGSGGAYVTWMRDPNPSSIVQHLTAQGSVAMGWPAGGVPVANSPAQQDPRVVSDAAGGAMVVWIEGSLARPSIYAQRFVDEGPVAAELALASSDAEPDRVRLRWMGTGAGSLVAQVERSSESGWEPLGPAAADGPDALRFEDRGVSPSRRYGYRLAYVEDGIPNRSAETWVDVPMALAFELAGFRPNPLGRSGEIRFTLAEPGAARLEVLDVTGRRVLEREVGDRGPGHHRLAMNAQLAPGVYLLRLTQGDRVLHTRGAVLR